jgi:acetylornithine deacetylase/succinyl-diaminopimelate desuccinylase-like protein
MPRSWMDRRRRQAARIALYTSLVLSAGAALGFRELLDRPIRILENERWVGRDYRSMPEVQLLRQYVQIDTSEAGSEVPGARFLAAQLAAAGIPAHVEVLGERSANIYALLEGKDPRPLVLHHHIDVQTVNPEEWRHPPFAAHLEPPWIYGRGVFDMKSVAIAQLLAMIDLKKSGKPLARSVLFLGTSGEERGSHLGVLWILRQHPELVRSFWAVLTEGGVLEARAFDDFKFWGVEFAQKRFFDLILCSGDREQLEGIRSVLNEIGHTETDLRLVDEARILFDVYAPTRDDAELRRLLSAPETVLGDIAAFRRLPTYIRSMYRNEAVPFPVEEAPGGGYRMLVKLHLLPGQELEPVLDELVPPWLIHGVPATLDAANAAPVALHGSPADHPALRTIVETLGETHPDVPIGPYLLPWTATDARFFRAAGVPSYGFSPFLIMSTDTLQVDGANERMALPGYVEGVALYRQVVRRLALDTP